ncbi:glutamine-synthetase adenylyltransferase [Sulfitobacter sp. TSTF-M16]|uniref:Glutamine-synthetase adenylyltransferase n=1 Tax=Sulfitobacter aestuariivivens TaxID=2766981 RepID=A0A927HE68_9RHOB|nr:glutamine-synthetase adenylyltransferase [Sulfitobacter aestuariivivens]MBD3663068.1 glutamine-synthetase adenylyltransferase [Sulfitobacter aestuariivivens]
MTTASLSTLMTRMPRRYHAGRAEDAEALVAALDRDARTLAVNAASTAPYLLGLLEKEASWLQQAAEDPHGAVARVIGTAAAHPPEGIAAHLRQAKRRVALMTALADLGGAWGLEEVTRALTDFADAACQSALRAGLTPQIRRGKVPGMTEDDLHDAAGMVVLAMGKMGAGELNYSSDIDLICLFDETRFDRDDFHAARSAFVRATRTMSGLLNDRTADGYVFRTDLRLRPDPAVTPVCMAMAAAENYYESLGRTWERAAYIKARPCAGDLEAGARFLETLRPFVWRKHLDFAAIQDAHDMRLAIREHKGLGGAITLPGHDMKLGRGGIREIEFFTQTRQLISGGRDPDLRVRDTCGGLDALAEKGWVPSHAAEALQDHYRAHRMIEHRQQMVQDAQTHLLPQSDAGFDRLACMVDMDTHDLKADLRTRLGAVHEITEGFFAASRAPAPARDVPAAHIFDAKVLDRWPSYPALRSERGSEIFKRLKPDLLARLAAAGKPDEALLAFDGFLAGLPAGVQLFSLLKANPQLADLLIDIVSTSPALAAHLSRNAGVFDAVIGGDFFSDWPGEDALAAMLQAELSREPDYEARLDGTRRWAREWHFRIGVHLLRGLIAPEVAGAQYADLARSVLRALWPVVGDQFATRHGPPPGRGAVLLGMGSLGAGRLNATSDLDMIVIYDAQGVESSDGKRPLAARLYYARLTQAMITAMTAPMAQGRLYEIDMRLRPSGNQGPVATSLGSFESYQKTQAWVWEHLALTRAAVVAGPHDLVRDVEQLRREILGSGQSRAHVMGEVAAMRARIAAAKAPEDIWDAKIGPGRLQDIELLAQGATLSAGQADRAIASGLALAEAQDIVRSGEAATLQAAYRLAWALQCATRLLSAGPLAVRDLGQAGTAFLCRTLESDTLAELETQMQQSYAQAAGIIDRALGAYQGREDSNEER